MHFESLYNSYQHLPWIAWVPVLIMGVVLLRRLDLFRGALVAMLAITFLDAMCCGMWAHLGGAESPWFRPISLLFILLGDARYFYLMYRLGKYHDKRDGGWGPARMLLPVVAWTVLPTLLLGAGRLLFPASFGVARVEYVIYEMTMFCSVILFQLGLLPTWLERADGARRRWLVGLTWVELAHYGLWILSDVLILEGVDVGYAIRFVPDLIYYACFIPAFYLLAPEDERTRARSDEMR